MSQDKSRISLNIDGMTCANCERRIREKVSGLPGVHSVKISYTRGTGEVAYDPEAIGREEIIGAIEAMDYAVSRGEGKVPEGRVRSDELLGILLILLAGYMILRHLGVLNLLNVFPQAEAGMGYGMILVIGLLTSVHCVAMCGGLSLSQCLPGEAAGRGWTVLRPSLLYNLGRVVSYTIVGGAVGALGSVISFSGGARGVVQLIAGAFMVLMGINMLGILPWLRRITPRLPGFAARCPGKGGGRSPLVVGLLNGLMPCGPLQAMQLYALSTGDPVKGALSMLLFSLGTVPLMFGLGALSTLLSGRFTRRVMAAGAALVVVLGVSMFRSGWALSGWAVTAPAGGGQQAAATVTGGEAVQTISTRLAPRYYEPITVAVGVPVRWTIQADPRSLNGCNNRLYIPEYGIEKQLEHGDNLIEFTPTSSGTFAYSCWMGMIRSTITVTEADGSLPEGAGGADEAYSGYAEPPRIPTGYQIPVEEVAVARIDGDTQRVTIAMDNEQFSPAVVVMQAGLETQWVIENIGEIDTLILPLYYVRLALQDGENAVYLIPETDFDFYAADGSFFGYVKVVEELGEIDLEAIRREVAAHQTLAWDFSAIP